MRSTTTLLAITTGAAILSSVHSFASPATWLTRTQLTTNARTTSSSTIPPQQQLRHVPSSRVAHVRRPTVPLALGMSLPWARRDDVTKTTSLFGKCNAVATKTFQQLLLKLRRTLSVLIVSTLLLLGSIGARTSPSHASSSGGEFVAPAVVSRVVPKSESHTIGSVSVAQFASSTTTTKFDRMIDRYVQQRMYDDDKYDAFESSYRESIADKSGLSQYPEQLTDAAASVLGKEAATAGTTMTASTDLTTDGGGGSKPGEGVENAIVKAFMTATNFLETKLKLSRGVASALLASGGMLIFPAMGVAFTGFSIRQRRRIERDQMREFGEVQELYANEKVEYDDDDDDEYDDDDDDEDYDDDDDDEEEDDDEE